MKYKNFNHLSVPGDGDCFFHSLVTIFSYEMINKPPDNIEKQSISLRKKVIKWLENNPQYKLSTGLTIRDEINDAVKDETTNAKQNNRVPKYKNMNEYLDYMKKKGSYAGQIEIYGVANVYNRNIRTYSHIKNKFRNIGLGYTIDDKKYIDDIYLYHNIGKTKSKGLHHFEPMIIKNSLQKINPYLELPVKKKSKRKKSIPKKSKKKSKRKKSIPKKSKRKKYTKRNIKR
jgi:hypothetical protein